MNQVSTTEAISTIVTYLGSKLAKEKSIKSFFSEFTEATINWIKPLFLKKDGTEKEAIQKFKEKVESKARQSAIKSILEMEIEDNPGAEKNIMEMFEQIAKNKKGAKIVVENIKTKKEIEIINKQKGKGVATFNDFTAGGNIKIDNQQDE